MKKQIIIMVSLLMMSFNTAMAAAWIPVVVPEEVAIPIVSFDEDSFSCLVRNNGQEKNISKVYFWEKIMKPSGNYEIRLARLDLSDYSFYDALIRENIDGRDVNVKKRKWVSYGNMPHPVNDYWRDKVLRHFYSKMNQRKVTVMNEEINLSQVDIPK